MNRLAAVLLLAGCTAAPGTVTDTSTTGITTSSTSSGPSDCVATCVRVTPQLERDFAVLPSNIDCPRQFGDAPFNTSCAACSERFSEVFGVSLTCR